MRPPLSPWLSLAPRAPIRRDAPAPMLRRGPRPLLMHLALNLPAPWSPSSPSCAASSPGSGTGSSGSRPGADAPAHPLARLDPALVAGIAAYRRHPYQRDLPEPPLLWQDGAARLYDYGRPDPEEEDTLSVLFVPSLINRGSILDLTRGRSMLRWLAARRVRPLLLEWGWPEGEECGFGLADYIARRLEPAMAAAAASDRRGRIVLAGYCMGGLLALAAAQRQPGLVAGLCLIATPWDFQAGGGEPAVAARLRRLDSLMAPSGSLPVDAIQLAFASLDPAAIAAKFRRFGRLAQDGEATRLFVAIEDWLSDGVPLAAPVARECLGGWYGENQPALGRWRVAGTVVDPATLRLPTLLAVPRHDRIVPPDSALALRTAMRHARLLELPGGHVGIVAGPRAPELLWRPLLRWLRGVERGVRKEGQGLRPWTPLGPRAPDPDS